MFKAIGQTLTKLALTATLALTLVNSASAAYLFMPAEDDNATFRAEVSAILGVPFDYFDPRGATPSLATLLTYDGVFTWTNFSYLDETALGDVLADYVDAGGRVVLGAFTTYTNGNSLAGRILTSGYSPVSNPTGSNLFTSSGYSGNGTSALWGGVASYTATYRDDVILQGAGILDGTFADGAIAGAYRPDGRVVYLGGLDTVGGTSGDEAQLLANAFTLNPTAVPEPSSFAFVSLGIVAFGAALRKRNRR